MERHKVLQILVNLIRNAKYACDDSGRNDKEIILRIAQDKNRMRLSGGRQRHWDSSENLSRIFSHGFTTRKEGHGFGLHSGRTGRRRNGRHSHRLEQRPRPGSELHSRFTHIPHTIMKNDSRSNRRILVIDDNRAIHDDFRKILLKSSTAPNDLADEEAALYRRRGP